MQSLEIQCVQEEIARDLPLPALATTDSAGADLRAALEAPITIPPGGFTGVPTGLRIAIPSGFEGQVRPRSGLAARHGVTCLNTPGTIDADYRGVLKVLIINHGTEPFTIEHGDRIAQLVIAPVTAVTYKIATKLQDTARGDGGFGHTGVK